MDNKFPNIIFDNNTMKKYFPVVNNYPVNTINDKSTKTAYPNIINTLLKEGSKYIKSLKNKKAPPLGINQLRAGNKTYNIKSLTPEQLNAQFLNSILSNSSNAQEQNINNIAQDRNTINDIYNLKPQNNIDMTSINKQVAGMLPEDYAPLAKTVLTLNLIKDAMETNKAVNTYNRYKNSNVITGLIGNEANLNNAVKIPSLKSTSKKSNTLNYISNLIGAASKLRNPNTGAVDKKMLPLLNLIYKALGVKQTGGWLNPPPKESDLKKVNERLK